MMYACSKCKRYIYYYKNNASDGDDFKPEFHAEYCGYLLEFIRTTVTEPRLRIENIIDTAWWSNRA